MYVYVDSNLFLTFYYISILKYFVIFNLSINITETEYSYFMAIFNHVRLVSLPLANIFGHSG